MQQAPIFSAFGRRSKVSYDPFTDGKCVGEISLCIRTDGWTDRGRGKHETVQNIKKRMKPRKKKRRKHAKEGMGDVG